MQIVEVGGLKYAGTFDLRITKQFHNADASGGHELPSDMFGAIFGAALNNVNTTNKYLSDAENEEIKLAMGQATSTHDLAIALQKASTALQYTVTVKNSFMEAYRTLINMQI